MKISPLELIMIFTLVIAGLCIIVRNRKEKLCDTSLGPAPLGMPRNWTRRANPFLNGMYS